jgi:hypothetical protein
MPCSDRIRPTEKSLSRNPEGQAKKHWLRGFSRLTLGDGTRIKEPQKEKANMKFRLRNLKKLIDSKTWDNERVIYNVEPEAIEIAELYAKFFLNRYHKQSNGHWNRNEKRNTFVGLLCQKIFHIILMELAVPCDCNDPLIDWRKQKHFDFNIANFGSVEVKGYDYQSWIRNLLIKQREWHRNDYVVVFKLKDFKPTKVDMMGFLTKEGVERLRISRRGEPLTPLADAYTTDFGSLKPSYKFISMLRKASME